MSNRLFCEDLKLGISFGMLMVMICVTLITSIMSNIMRKKSFKNNRALNLWLSFVVSVALFIRYGLSLEVLQGIGLFFILLYASCSDITSHTVDDCLWVMILLLGLCSAHRVGIASMLIGAAGVFIPQVICVLITKKAVGGADIKLSASLGFLLGAFRGMIALIIGLLVSVIVMTIIQKRKKEKQPFALVPFLSVAGMAAFFI